MSFEFFTVVTILCRIMGGRLLNTSLHAILLAVRICRYWSYSCQQLELVLTIFRNKLAVE